MITQCICTVRRELFAALLVRFSESVQVCEVYFLQLKK